MQESDYILGNTAVTIPFLIQKGLGTGLSHHTVLKGNTGNN